MGCLLFPALMNIAAVNMQVQVGTAIFAFIKFCCFPYMAIWIILIHAITFNKLLDKLFIFHIITCFFPFPDETALVPDTKALPTFELALRFARYNIF